MPPKTSSINFQNLSVEQLSGLKEQLDVDIQSLGRAYDALRGARNRFQDSKGCLEQFKSIQKDQPILVPLTSSLYVNGTVLDNTHVLVDVGTGYYVKQSVSRAQDFFGKRANQMKDSMDNIADHIQGKQRQQNQVMDVMQQKSQAIQAAQQQQ
ncbi:prefoldin 5-like protein, putative [Bodo saltans]|uniref:Prefoldin 5-like protein, putative n=1 Tax=Bodo saltans TaxID=75058 RepID=A0A0S4IRG2_BODSA|nr:prefoldin 5-like protein, putative [Bodo saltans]|eukprot:CUE80831.1 prefoldin 5-like protein, putative [Bodo saltans]